MSTIEDLLRSNARVAEGSYSAPPRQPARNLAIVTCMDARIDPLALFGLSLGDANILRNAGGRVTDDVVRTLTLAVSLFSVEAVVVLHHTGCGLVGTTNTELQKATRTTIDFLPILDHTSALERDVQVLREAHFLRPPTVVGGLLEITSGVVSVVVPPR